MLRRGSRKSLFGNLRVGLLAALSCAALAANGCGPPSAGPAAGPAAALSAGQATAAAGTAGVSLDEQAGQEERALRRALDEAVAGVESGRLAVLLRDHWAHFLTSHPLEATRLGVHAYDDKLMDRSAAATAARVAFARQLLQQAQRLPSKSLSARDQITLAMFVDRLRASVDTHEQCRFHVWSFSARDNPITEWNNLPEVHRVKTPRDGERLLARYQQVAKVIDDDIANLRAGLAEGLVVNAESARRVLKMVDDQLQQPREQWPLLSPAKKAHPDWTSAEQLRFKTMLGEAVATAIEPALRRYRALLHDEVIKKARDDSHAGLSALPIGAACYAVRMRANVTLELDADAIHQLGRDEISRLDAAMAALGKKQFGATTLAATLAALRDDKALYFETSAQVKAAAEEILRDAKALMPQHFGRLPKADCVVRPIPDYEAPYTTIAYYRPPHTDGSKPGEYFINVHAPKTRPRFEARVLGVHEAIFGHHLQIAIAQELGEMPAFRKHGHVTAYVEGWALYTERLGHEVGLYKTDLDVMGMLSFDAWRAARLVVDTGIHAKGWSRDQARRYMAEHTALSANNIDNEVDRYISWPGQALGYKMGQLEILRLREQLKTTLGARFSLAAFHDAVLEDGALTLPLLRERVVAKLTAKPSAAGR